jgi:hypothetical protein
MAEALENLMFDTLMTALASIGVTVGPLWATSPSPLVGGGIPNDSIQQVIATYAATRGVAVTEAIYLEHLTTSAKYDASTGPAGHVASASFRVYLISVDTILGTRKVRNLKADVLRALFSAENAFSSVYGYTPAPGPYALRPDLFAVGVSAGVLDIDIDFNESHAVT